MQITIEYKSIDSQHLMVINLSPEEYFDLDPDETPSIDSIPFYNHAIDYINIDSKNVEHTKLNITDSDGNCISRTTENFWNFGQNRIIERNDYGVEPY
jgi:hypothetical protein